MKQGDLFDQGKYPPRDKQELAEKFPNLNTSWRSHAKSTPVRPVPRMCELTQEELAWSKHLAEKQLDKWHEDGMPFTMDTPLETKKWSSGLGARGEIYAAKCYDWAFIDYFNRKGRPDFGPLAGPGVYVRATNATFFPRIPIHPHDPEDSVYLSVCEFFPGKARIQAWCWGSVKREVPLTNPKPFGEHIESKPVHLVPMNLVDTIFGIRGEEIPQHILDLCPKGYRPWMVR